VGRVARFFRGVKLCPKWLKFTLAAAAGRVKVLAVCSAKITMFDALMSNAMKELKFAMIFLVACASNADAFNSVYLRGKGLGGEMSCSDWNRARGNEKAVLMSWVFGFITGYDAAIHPDPSDGFLDGQAIVNFIVSLCKEHPDGDVITVAKSIAEHLEKEVTGEVNPPIILKKSAAVIATPAAAETPRIPPALIGNWCFAGTPPDTTDSSIFKRCAKPLGGAVTLKPDGSTSAYDDATCRTVRVTADGPAFTVEYKCSSGIKRQILTLTAPDRLVIRFLDQSPSCKGATIFGADRVQVGDCWSARADVIDMIAGACGDGDQCEVRGDLSHQEITHVSWATGPKGMSFQMKPCATCVEGLKKAIGAD
jgi:hypothetical protein